MQSPVQRPASAVSALTGWIGLAGFLCSLAAIIAWQPVPLTATLWVLLAAGLPMLLLEILRGQRPADFFGQPGHQHSPAWHGPRILTKLTGFALAWAALGLWFHFIPIYQRPEYFQVLLRLEQALPAMIVLGIGYVVWCDRRMVSPLDGAWHTGLLVLRPLMRRIAPSGPEREARIDAAAAAHFLLGWFIKGFFLVFLVSLLPGNLRVLAAFPKAPFDALGQFVFWSTNLLFTIDIVLACIGYACTFKPLGAHIRSVNPTLMGWIAALACYPPFTIIGGGNLIDYQSGGTFWDLWLRDAPMLLKWGWGIALIGCLVLYTWATVAFGIRFSNLTDRGILTHGPYRVLRHPAYVAKNAYWWLVHVPWINALGGTAALKCCLMLLAVNAIYALRAWTEEQHLSQDPVYVQYRNWTRSRSLWQRLRD